MTEPLPLVLVHGAWHGAWCWSALQAELDRRGLASYAFDLPGHGASTLPLGDVHANAAHVAASIEALGKDVVLVGHSYGGVIVTEASTSTTRVKHLVYLTAFVPDEGESLGSLLAGFPPVDVPLTAAIQPQDDGTMLVEPGGAVASFYGMCTSEVAAAAVARLCPESAAALGQPTTGAGWKTIPSTYIRCTEDRAIDIEHQTIMASRCNDVQTLHADHSPFASAVTGTADILERIVRP